MRKLLQLALLLLLAIPAYPQGQNFGGGGSGGATIVTSNPATCVKGAIYYNTVSGQTLYCTAVNTLTPGAPVSNPIPTAGLLFDYQALPTESAAGLVDYSGNGNNATGTVGVAPTLTTVTGGVSCPGTGAISLPAADNTALTVLFYISYQAAAQTSSTQRGMVLANTGYSGSFNTNGTDLQFAAAQSGVFNNRIYQLNTVNTSPGGGLDAAVGFNSSVSGVFSLVEQMNSTVVGNSYDHVFVNGVDQNPNYTSNNAPSSNSVVTAGLTGNYQLCGITSLSNYMVGTIYRATGYTTVLNQAQISQWHQATVALMASRGVSQSTGITQVGNNVILVGDSEFINLGNTIPNNIVFANTPTNLDLLANAGLQMGVTITPMVQTDVCMNAGLNGQNLAVLWGGTNDVGASIGTTTILGNILTWARAAKACGVNKVLVATPIDRTGLGAAETALSTSLVQNWQTSGVIDGLIDLHEDVNLGCQGCSANTTYTDGTHATQQGAYQDQVPQFNRAINRILGPNNFSSATVYSTISGGAIATTAVSETGNTMSFTSAGWTANQFVPGTSMTCTGITNTGPSYNSTYPGWYILTNSGTIITAYNQTTGGGAASVQGSCIGTTQQNQDQYNVLNMGAGNFTIQSCNGFTGQSIYIKNINAAATTIVPFGTETIDGAANFSIGPNVTLTLTAQLTSPTAGGCTWVTATGSIPATRYSTFLTSGTSWTAPATIRPTSIVKITLVGGGNAGGTSAAATIGLPGGAGCTIVVEGTATSLGIVAGTSYTYAIGAATGGSTTFAATSTYTAAGGTAGGSLTSAAIGVGLGGVGGTCTNGTVLTPGQPGSVGEVLVITTTYQTGTGGSTILGAGGQPVISGAVGNPGTGYGAGGSGGGVGTHAGGAGTAGAILIEITI